MKYIADGNVELWKIVILPVELCNLRTVVLRFDGRVETGFKGRNFVAKACVTFVRCYYNPTSGSDIGI